MAKATQPNLSSRETLRAYLDASLRHRREAYLALLHPVGAVILGVATPYYAGKVFAAIVQNSSHVNQYLIAFAIASIVGIICNRYGFLANMRLQAFVMADLQDRVLTRLLRRSAGFHANNISGKLISDALDYVTAYSSLAGVLLLSGLGFGLVIVTGIIIVSLSSWQLGLYLFVVAMVTIAWAALESRTRYHLRNERHLATKRVTAHLSDTIVNIQAVKTFAREKDELRHNADLGVKLRDLRLSDWQRTGRSGNDRTAALLLMQFLLLLLISHLIKTNPHLLAAGIFAFTYTLTLTIRLFEINDLTRRVEESLLQASSMTQVLLEDVEITDKPDARELVVQKGAITLDDISFSYAEEAGDQSVFHSLSLAIAPGEKVGLVGPSGGGKSTLTRLLLRFEDLNAGSITIDNQNIAEVTQASLRQAISYVPQEPLLFHRSIRENIAYGKPDATEKEVIAAARRAQAHGFIQQLVNGYETVVGERGVKLSGGQRQRVAIARAILKNAPILVLDEATSALDSESEVMIQKALENLMKGKTTIVIAHRLSTIQRMDRIVVLDDGKIIEEGSHRALQQHGGLYSQLWKHQSGGFLEED